MKAIANSDQSTEMDLLTCRKRTNQFCFCCARYTTAKQRMPFNETAQRRYKETFNLKKIVNVDENFTPKIVCKTCRRKLGDKSNRNNIKTPAIWNTPADDHRDCYLCNHNLSPQDVKRSISKKTKKNKNPYEYQSGFSVILPVYRKAGSGVTNPQSNNKDSEMDSSNKMVSSDEEE